MSLRATARQAAASAFAAADDVKTWVLVKLGPIDDDYDAEKDRVERSWEQVVKVQVIPYNETTGRNRTGSVGGYGSMAGDESNIATRSFLILGADLTAENPNQEGEIQEITTGTTWQFSELIADPTRSVWIAHCTA